MDYETLMPVIYRHNNVDHFEWGIYRIEDTEKIVPYHSHAIEMVRGIIKDGICTTCYREAPKELMTIFGLLCMSYQYEDGGDNF